MYTRREVRALPPGDTTIADYRAAVAVMMGRDDDDPTSWSFQAAIHGTHRSNPKPAFNQCKHGTFYFLPWHRMYLWYFEQIVRAAIPDRDAAASWALPYWNYGLGGQHATLPEPFRQAQVDGKPNSLYVPNRKPGMNDGRGAIPPSVADPAHALRHVKFIGPTQTDRTPQFGGGPANPGAQFSAYTGSLENSPHNIVHDLVGGPMGDPDQAAADPIFWLHHANIDRIWVDWIGLGAGRANPTQRDWTGQSFGLFDRDGHNVSLRCDQVERTDATPLDYVYEEVHVPEPERSRRFEAIAARPIEPPARAPEPVGGSTEPLVLSGQSVSTTVQIDQQARSQVVGAEAHPQRVVLSVEEIETDADAGTSYGIYVDLPADADEETAAAHYAGPLSFFGAKRAQNPRGDQAPHSLVVAHDITELVQRLVADGQWNGHDATVTFRPIGLVAAEGGQEHVAAPPPQPHPPVTIGRIAVLYS